MYYYEQISPSYQGSSSQKSNQGQKVKKKKSVREKGRVLKGMMAMMDERDCFFFLFPPRVSLYFLSFFCLSG